MSEKEMTLAETRGVVEPDGVREIRELVGKAGRWTQYTIDVLLDYIDTLTAALAEARREREAWKERYLKEAANHDTTRSAWGKEEANMIRAARALFAEVERLREATTTFVAWLEHNDAGPKYDGAVRGTPEGDAVWSAWWEENMRLCAKAMSLGRAALEAE